MGAVDSHRLYAIRFKREQEKKEEKKKNKSKKRTKHEKTETRVDKIYKV
jgi:hypothetical protein